MEWFPFDQQTCDMTFVSWDDESQVLLDDSGPSTSPQEVEYDGEWKIIGKLNMQELSIMYCIIPIISNVDLLAGRRGPFSPAADVKP